MTTSQEKLKEIKQKADRYNNGAIRLNADIEAAQDNAKRLAQQAKEEFGTSDLEELKNMLQQINEKNEATLAKGEKDVIQALENLQNTQEQLNKIKNPV